MSVGSSLNHSVIGIHRDFVPLNSLYCVRGYFSLRQPGPIYRSNHSFALLTSKRNNQANHHRNKMQVLASIYFCPTHSCYAIKEFFLILPYIFIGVDLCVCVCMCVCVSQIWPKFDVKYHPSITLCIKIFFTLSNLCIYFVCIL